jgi:predicted regulator of Ras-like GTPase activity (Roadblock/LC7/MglB family)
MVDRSEGRAGLIMGKDGIAVSNYVRKDDQYDIERVGVEYNRIIENIKDVTKNLKFGEIDEITLVTDKHRILIKPLNDDYFIALAVDVGIFPGKASFILQSMALKARARL